MRVGASFVRARVSLVESVDDAADGVCARDEDPTASVAPKPNVATTENSDERRIGGVPENGQS